MSEYTKEPEMKCPTGPELWTYSLGENGAMEFVIGGEPVSIHRIVACVNALAGIDDPEARIAKFAEYRDISDERIAYLEARLEDAQDLSDIRWAKIEVLKEQLATARNEALSEVLNIIRENTPYTPPDGPETAEHLVAIESMQSIHDLVEALKTKEPTK